MIGDRADVTPLHGRTWDAAIDTSGYDPAHVAASAALDVGHYVFVSSCNAYPDWPEQPVDEDSPIWQDGEGYGPDKAAAERAVLPAGAVVRAGLIVGPHDNVFRLPWWVKRIAQGGTVPAPGDPERRMQVIDARDLAAFLLDLAEQRVAGAFNGTGPIGQTTMRELLEAAGDAELRWIPDEQLEAAERRAVDGAAAVAAGALRGHVARRHRARPGRRACAAGRSRRPSPTCAPGSRPAARPSSTTGAPSTGRRRCLMRGRMRYSDFCARY